VRNRRTTREDGYPGGVVLLPTRRYNGSLIAFADHDAADTAASPRLNRGVVAGVGRQRRREAAERLLGDPALVIAEVA
jgi:hypothetical protein